MVAASRLEFESSNETTSPVITSPTKLAIAKNRTGSSSARALSASAKVVQFDRE